MSNVYILPTLPIAERIARQRRRFISARFVIQRGLNQGQPIKAISGVLCCASLPGGGSTIGEKAVPFSELRASVNGGLCEHRVYTDCTYFDGSQSKYFFRVGLDESVRARQLRTISHTCMGLGILDQPGKNCPFILSLPFEYRVGRSRMNWARRADNGLTCSAAGVCVMTSAALASDLDAWCSPSAAITLARASRAASASAAMARCNCCGSRTSFLHVSGRERGRFTCICM